MQGLSADARPVVVVVGAGISGLAASHRLREIDPRIQVVMLEAGSRPGGLLHTVHEQGFLIEESADSFITSMPYGLDLCKRVGLGDRVVATNPDRRRAFVVSKGRLEPIPDGLMVMAPSRLWPMATTKILSPLGKLRLGLELFQRPGDGSDESIAAFARRRFGKETYDRLIQPLIGGIYTGDPDRLSLQATQPRFQEMEQSAGSLIRAALRERRAKAQAANGHAGSGARYGLFVGLRDGMSSLVNAIVARLPEGSIRYDAQVDHIERNADGTWILKVKQQEQLVTLQADAVIIATPAQAASRVVRTIHPRLSSDLAKINSTSCAIVSLGYRQEQVGRHLDGFGFVVPLVENREILSGSFSSVKFVGRAPEGFVLIRTFLGGAFDPQVLDRDDDSLTASAVRELSALLGVKGEPIVKRISRWPNVMPQYELGHLDLVRSIESAVEHELAGIAIAGNAYHGVGVPQCIQSGEAAASRVASYLQANGTEKDLASATEAS